MSALRRDEPTIQPVVLFWPQFQEMFSRAHHQGEHVAIVGPTGSGKSAVGLELCKIIGSRTAKDGAPARVVILATKNRDKTLTALSKQGWPIIKEWPPGYGEEHCIVWPRNLPASQKAARQAPIFRKLIDRMHAEGGQTMCVDEEAYFEENQPDGLGLSGQMGIIWSEGRSSDLTVIGATQRPRNVTRLMWSEPSWLIIFRIEDWDDLKRVAELSGQRIAVVEIVQKLGPHEFLCVRRQRGGLHELYVSRVDVVPVSPVVNEKRRMLRRGRRMLRRGQ